MASPASAVRAARNRSGRSPSAAAKENASTGPRSGAITMAPITTATLFADSPTAATTVDSSVSSMKSDVIAAPPETS